MLCCCSCCHCVALSSSKRSFNTVDTLSTLFESLTAHSERMCYQLPALLLGSETRELLLGCSSDFGNACRPSSG